MKKKNTTRIIAIVLVLLMALALIPIAASAEGPFTITFTAGEGATGDDQTMPTDADGKIIMPGATVNAVTFTKEDYHLTGWSDGTNTYAPGTEQSFEANATLTAAWAVNNTVTFNPGNGASGTSAERYADADGRITLPTADALSFSKEHYQLVGWNTDPNAESGTAPGSQYTTTAETTALYGIWVHNTVTVSFAPGDHGNGTMGNASHPEGEDYTVPGNGFTADKGYVFSKWSDGSHQYAPNDIIEGLSSALTLTAQWQPISVNIGYDKGGGKGTDPLTPPAGPYQFNDGFNLPSCPYTRSGHQFDGWEISPSDDGEGHAIVQNEGDQLDWSKVVVDAGADSLDITVTATWAETVTISYTPNGGTPVPSSDVIKKGDSLTKLPEISKQDYTFLGWYNNEEKISVPYSPETNKNLAAKWRSNYITFEFKPGDGSGSMSSDKALRSAGEYTLPTESTFTAPENKALAGWNIGGERFALGGKYTINNDTSEKVEVTALWDDKCKVDFNAGAGTITGESTIYVAKGTKIPTASIPTAERSGFTFLGWYDADDTKLDGSYPEITGPKVFTAKWTNNSVTVTLDPNTAHGGGGSSTTQSMSRVNTGTLYPFSSLGMSSPSGKVFKGWAKSQDAATPDFADEASIKWNGASGDANYAPPAANPENPGEVTLYALWDEQLTGTLTVKDKTSGNDATDPVKVGQTLLGVASITKPDNPGTLSYRWMAEGVATPLGTGAEYTVKAGDYNKKIYCEVSNASDYSYSIKSSSFTVASDTLMNVPVTVSGVDTNNYVIVNGVTVKTESGMAQVPPGGIVEVQIVHNTDKYASKVEFGEGDDKFTIEGADVGVVNRHKAPDTGSSYPVAVTFTSNDTPGTKKTATIDWSVPDSVLNPVKTAVITKVANAKGMTASEKSRIKAVIHEYVPCWDDIITRRLTQAQIDSAGPDELVIYFTYPADLVTKVNDKDLSSNIPAYYSIEVYHGETLVGKAGDGKVTAQKAYSAPQAVAVKGQKSFSPYALVLSPNELDGSVLIKGKNSDGNASIGSPLTAEYKDGATAHVGTLSYQWQVKNGDDFEDIPGDAAKAATFTPADTSYNGKQIRCKVTSSFEYGSKESDPVTVVNKPNPSLVRFIIRGNNELSGVVGNVTSKMEYTRTSTNKTPGSSATWTPITSTTFNVWESGYYWVRFKDDASSVSDSVYVPLYYTVTAYPDSVSTNRLYFTASGDSGIIERISNKEWLVPENKSINVTANSANTTYYKITQISRKNTETGKVTTRTVNRSNSGSTGSFTVDAPFYVWASAGVYGSKTGDNSHLQLWVELAALSMMGLGAALVIGRKKLKEQK